MTPKGLVMTEGCNPSKGRIIFFYSLSSGTDNPEGVGYESDGWNEGGNASE